MKGCTGYCLTGLCESPCTDATDAQEAEQDRRMEEDAREYAAQICPHCCRPTYMAVPAALCQCPPDVADAHLSGGGRS